MRSVPLLVLRALLVVPVLIAPALVAQPGEMDQEFFEETDFDNDLGDVDSYGEEADEEEYAEPGDEAEVHQQREEMANDNFQAIMDLNAAKSAKPQAATSNLSFGATSNVAPIQPLPSPSVAGAAGPAAQGATAEVPLDRFEKLRAELRALEKKNLRRAAPPVVLGGSSYVGTVEQGALKLSLRLQVTLGAPDQWKTVPLVGAEVVVVRAQSGGRDLPLSSRNGYHVWVTRRTGEVPIDIDLLVPPRGPRGSIEYDFLVARTPVTLLTCRFPVPGLEPRLSAAVRSDFRNEGGQTLLDATLRPTARIHMVGFRDLGEAEERQAKLYAESLNLLSIDEGGLDLFTVIRYNILYAGTKNFEILLPKGMTVASADGMGAFRFTLEPREDGTLLKGETAFPIRNSYEISLRLHREMKRGGEEFNVLRPRPVGVEREYGYLGVEVPGKLKLEPRQVKNVLAVDVRQLPAEMLQSAVSPILRAYRYHTPNAEVRLAVNRLPEKEPAAGSIDRVRAFSVLSSEGKLLTEMRITLRNRLRHNLVLTLPEGALVRSTLLDGQPVKPSKNDAGKLMLPLKRSEGGAHLKPFTLQVVLEQQLGVLGLLGFAKMRLPAVDLPASSVAWSLWVPARNRYSRPRGDIEPQLYWGTGRWHQSGASPATTGEAFGMGGLGLSSDGDSDPHLAAVDSSNAGAMPVRIKLPKSGSRLEYNRYWLHTGQAVQIAFSYIRGWVLIPIALVLLLVLSSGLLIGADALLRQRRIAFASWPLGLALTLATVWPLVKVGDTSWLVMAVVVAVVGVALLRGWVGAAKETVSTWAQEVPDRLKRAWEERKTEEVSTGRKVLRVFWRLGLGFGFFVFGIALLFSVLELVALLASPLSG